MQGESKQKKTQLARDVHVGFAHSCYRASLWALVVVDLSRAPGPSRLSEDGLATGHCLPHPPLPPLSVEAFPQMPGNSLPIEKTPLAFPPRVASCKPDRAMGGHRLWRKRERKEHFLKTRLFYFPLGLHQLPTWHMNLFFPYTALRKAPYGRSSGPRAGFHPAYSDFLPGWGLQNDPPFRRPVEEERQEQRRHTELEPPAGSCSGSLRVAMPSSSLLHR